MRARGGAERSRGAQLELLLTSLLYMSKTEAAAAAQAAGGALLSPVLASQLARAEAARQAGRPWDGWCGAQHESRSRARCAQALTRSRAHARRCRCRVPSRARHSIQLIGMSATFPNFQQLADWWGAASYATTFRPVELQYQLKARQASAARAAALCARACACACAADAPSLRAAGG